MCRPATIAPFALSLILATLSAAGCRQPSTAPLPSPSPLLSRTTIAVDEDIWAPWRRPARQPLPPYTTLPTATQTVAVEVDEQALDGVARFAAKTDRPLPIVPNGIDWSDTAGVEIRLRFRVAAIPPARLPASHSLVRFSLGGGTLRQGFWLHAYSGNNGFMLNGLAYNRRPPWRETRLQRGAAVPHGAVSFDTRWHTIALAWCRGQLAATWDGLPILHVVDPTIDFSTLTIDWIDPGPDFTALEWSPIELRPATFAPP